MEILTGEKAADEKREPKTKWLVGIQRSCSYIKIYQKVSVHFGIKSKLNTHSINQKISISKRVAMGKRVLHIDNYI